MSVSSDQLFSAYVGLYQPNDPILVPMELRGAYSAPNEVLDSGEKLKYVIDGENVRFPLEEVAEQIGLGYARVAEFAIQSTGMTGHGSNIDICVLRGANLSEGLGWHPDGDFHTGRLVISDILPTEVKGRVTLPWEVVELDQTIIHRPRPNPSGKIRTRMQITRYNTEKYLLKALKSKMVV